MYMQEEKFLNSLQWQGNSKDMYKAVLSAVPPFFSGTVQKSIINWVKKNDIHTVTEQLVFKAVNEIAPTQMASSITSGLQKFKTER